MAPLIISPSDPLRNFVFSVPTTLSSAKGVFSQQQISKGPTKLESTNADQALWAPGVQRPAGKERGHHLGRGG